MVLKTLRLEHSERQKRLGNEPFNQSAFDLGMINLCYRYRKNENITKMSTYSKSLHFVTFRTNFIRNLF